MLSIKTDFGTVFTLELLPKFVAVSMCLLALQKLQDVETFSTMFLNYDLLARRWVRYGYLYPFGEGVAGVLMQQEVAALSSVLSNPNRPLAAVVGGSKVSRSPNT